MSKKRKNDDEVEKLYRIYIRVQSGERIALDELFKAADGRQVCKVDEMAIEHRLSHMDNILDAELILDNEKNRQEEKWVNSSYSKVRFKFPCLNKLLFAIKRDLLSDAKSTGYENGEKKKSSRHRKFYEGRYDVSDFNELMYETVIEIFNAKTDENNCLTLDGKKNERYPICDGASLLRNISYYTSRKINKREENSRLDIFDADYNNEEAEIEISAFDEYAYKKYLQMESATSRLMIYEEYLEWIKNNDVYKLFKINACDVKAMIETVMNCEGAFIPNTVSDMEIGVGMRLVKQEVLQEMIKSRHGINIKQENISKDMEIIEQRMLDHLFYSLNNRIDKAEKSKGIYEKESERFLYRLDKEAYVKIFSRASYEIYDKSIKFINNSVDNNNFNSYFRAIKKYEDMAMGIISLEKGKKKYDMVNLMLENEDLLENKKEALMNIANTMVSFYQKKEEKYRENELKEYKLKGFDDWKSGYWEAELRDGDLKIRLFSSRNVKKPIRNCIDRGKLMVYCGYINFYFCDLEEKVCYGVPKDRRVISRSNKKHEIFMYNIS